MELAETIQQMNETLAAGIFAAVGVGLVFVFISVLISEYRQAKRREKSKIWKDY